MKINNGPVLCSHCGSLSAYYELDRISAIRQNMPEYGSQLEWEHLVKTHKRKAFCLMCHKTLELPPPAE